jgi:type IV secretory pathway VirB10-like protein
MLARSPEAVVVCCLLWTTHCAAQTVAQEVEVPLVVSAGSVLRMRTEQTSFPKRAGDVVHAQLSRPVFAFDREVLPAGTEVVGHVISFSQSSRLRQAESMFSGHFGSFKKPEVQFDTVLQPGKAPRPIVTDTAPGNGQTVELRAESKSKHGILGSAVARGKQEISTRWKEAKDFLKAEDKRQRARDAAMGLLPYQPSRIISGSQFDAVLMTPQTFDTETVPAATILQLGQTAPEEGAVSANLLTGLDSAATTSGAPVEARLTEPLLAPDHRLLLPEGTRLIGDVSMVRPARHFHRNGQLRFSFQHVTCRMRSSKFRNG